MRDSELYLACFGGPPSDGALFTLLGQEHASYFNFGVRPGVLEVTGVSRERAPHFYYMRCDMADKNAMAICGVSENGFVKAEDRQLRIVANAVGN